MQSQVAKHPEAIPVEGTHVSPWIRVDAKVAIGQSSVGEDLLITPKGSKESYYAIELFEGFAAENKGVKLDRKEKLPDKRHVIKINISAPIKKQGDKDISFQSARFSFPSPKEASDASMALMAKISYPFSTHILATVEGGPNRQEHPIVTAVGLIGWIVSGGLLKRLR